MTLTHIVYLVAALWCMCLSGLSAEPSAAPTFSPTYNPFEVYFPVYQKVENLTLSQVTTDVENVFITAVRNSLICCEAYVIDITEFITKCPARVPGLPPFKTIIA